jgi:hypothetical protein
MQYRSLDDVIREGADWHKKAQNADGTVSREERRAWYAKAEYCYQFVLQHAPEDAPTMGALGSLYVEIGKWGLGVALLMSACRLMPDEPANWNALGAGYRKLDMLEQARAAFLTALPLARDDEQRVQLYHNMASTYVNEGEPQKAVEWCQKGLDIDPTNRQVRYNMGLAQLELGDFANGWDGYELGRIATTWARNYSHPGREVTPWDGSHGKNVVVFGEQGVGDEILFAHALPDLIRCSKSVIIECHPRLVQIFKQSFPECVVYGTRKDEEITWPAKHDIDAKVPIGSLHRFFRRQASEFPNYPQGWIKPDAALVDGSRSRIGRPRVGISWIGGTRDTHIALRSMPIERLAPILSIPGIDFVSLQYTPDAGNQVAKAVADHGWNITHDDEMNADLDKLFATIAGLDLVVTVLTSNVHFAGAMNVPAWILTPIKAPWQFMKDPMPWYPCHQLFRQKQHGEWSDVIDAIAANLRARFMRQAAE